MVFVHPSMSVETTFLLAKSYGYKIFSIITSLDTSKLNISLIEKLSDLVFYSQHSVEVDYPAIHDLIKTNQLKVDLVINGVDSSLYYADYLHNYLVGSPLIDLNLSKIRLNKYELNEYLLSNNIHIIPSIEIKCINDLETFKEQINDIGWPVVIKPSENSASMAGFSIANDFEQLHANVNNTLGSKNPYYKEHIMDKLILQKFITPDKYDEFAIDFLSLDGQHYLQAIVQYKKEQLSNGVYMNRESKAFVVSEVPGIEPVINYLQTILTVLKVNYGITHNEVFWNRATGQFYLIESNNRIPGSGLIDQYNYCYGFNVLQNIFDFLTYNKTPQLPYTRIEHSTVIKLYNYSNPNSAAVNLDGLNSVRQLITFYPDKYISDRNINSYNRADYIAAHVLLSSDSETSLNNDISELVSREENGALFT
ncbi:MAG: hypothetical protein QG673_509 [Pseudomonadota bacterium]|nr:hypothetical protein [Pseudomonadota bacterium]